MAQVLVFCGALAFYAFTLAPTVTWGDSAWLSLNAYWGTSQLGTAGNHPLFLQVGHLFSSLPGDVGRNVNLVSAVFGALTVMLVYRCGRTLGAAPVAAATGAGALCVSHAFWLHAVMAEVYTANAFFLVTILTLLLAWHRQPRWSYLAVAAGAFLIGLTNHLVLATAAPAAFVFIVATEKRRLLTRQGAKWLGAAAVSLLAAGVVFREALAAQVWRLWVGPPSISEYVSLRMDPGAVAREAMYYIGFLVYQFPSAALALGLIGAVVLARWQRRAALLLLLTIAVNALIFVRHSDWNAAGSSKFVFYIADYAVFAILVAVGAQASLEWVRARLSPTSTRRWTMGLLVAVILLPIGIYAAMPGVSRQLGLDLVGGRTLPYRANNRYFLNPNKRGDNGARRFGIEALETVAPGAVILADFTPCAVLKYVQFVERRRSDVLTCGEVWGGSHVPVRWHFEDGRRRPLYVVAADRGYYDFSALTGQYDIVPVGPIFEVRPR